MLILKLNLTISLYAKKIYNSNKRHAYKLERINSYNY